MKKIFSYGKENRKKEFAMNIRGFKKGCKKGTKVANKLLKVKVD